MSFELTLWAWEQCDLSSTQKLVLLDLCDRANAKSRTWPMQKTIAARVCLTPRAVCTALAALEGRGLIRRQTRFGSSGKRTSDMITVIGRGEPKTESGAGNSSPKSSQLPSGAGTNRSSESNSVDQLKAHRPANQKAPGETTQAPTETPSGDRRNVVPSDTRNRFNVISKDETHRLKRKRTPWLLERFPEPSRPDIDAYNEAVCFLEFLRTLIEEDIDWSSPGVQNIRLPRDWLSRFAAAAVEAAIMTAVIRRRGTRVDAKILSWKYFDKEISQLAAGGTHDSDGAFRDIA